MFSLDRTKIEPQNESISKDSSKKILDFFFNQIEQQIPLGGYALITNYFKSNYTIDSFYLKDASLQNSLSNILANNLEISSLKSNLDIYFDSAIPGYVCKVNKSDLNSYLILFCKEDSGISSNTKQVFQTYIQFLNKYIELENKYQKKQWELEILENQFYQLSHSIKNFLAEICILVETINLSNLSSRRDFGKIQAKNITKKINNFNIDIKKILAPHSQQNATKVPKLVKSQDTACNLKIALEKSIDNFKNLINRKNLQIKYPQQKVYLSTEPFKIIQIFDNLLCNAIYFSPQEEVIDFNWQSFQDEVLISIRDRGRGLSPEDMQNMFLPFYSRRENGEGLGLAVVKRLVTESQGNIWAENIVGGGTKISLVLPKQRKGD